MMKYWLMKSEPDAFSIDHLKAMPRKTDHWDGIRNYQARNFMRDQMAKGDLAFFIIRTARRPALSGSWRSSQKALIPITLRLMPRKNISTLKVHLKIPAG